MALIRDALRIVALVIGLLAAVIALIVDIVTVGVNHLLNNQSHGLIGFVTIVVGVIGALAAPFNGLVAAVLMLISMIVFFYAVGPIAAISGVFFVIAAILAYLDRSRAKAKAQAA